MGREVVIIGAGGHGRVIADIIECSGDKVYGFLDDSASGESFGYRIIGKTSDCLKFSDKYFIIAIGNNAVRMKISQTYPDLKYYTAIHPASVICRDAVIGEGTCVMANAVINASAKIGRHAIINTGAVVEHDNILGDFVHLSPNAASCGTVKIGNNTHIGAGVTIKNNTEIASNCIIGVGAAVVDNITVEGTYCGVPARLVRS